MRLGCMAIRTNVRPRENGRKERPVAHHCAQQLSLLLHCLRERHEAVILPAAQARVPRDE